MTRTCRIFTACLILGTPLLAWYALSRLRLVGWDGCVFLSLAALTPMPIVGAFVRKDLWRSPSSPPSASRDVAVAVAVSAIAVVLGTLIATLLGLPFSDALIASAATAAIAATSFFVAQGFTSHPESKQDQQHVLFERVTEQLTQATTREDVLSVIERTVRKVLPCEEVSFTACTHETLDLKSEAEERPMLSIRTLLHGRPVGLLRVFRPQGSTFSNEEVALLRTIANQATLALALVDRAASLDALRKKQTEAWEGERAAIIEALAAEIAHEVRYPINFFRSIFTREAKERQLDTEEVDIGCEEVERLERLVVDLRKVAVRRLERREVRVAEIIARAEMLLRDRLEGRAFSVDVPDDARVRCDADQITQVLVNLMSNAVSATKNGEDVGIDWKVDPSGASLIVWDDGPGFSCEPAMIFTPWFTTKSTGTGLGLAITHRIVRAHGWAVDPSRTGDRTTFTLSIPSSDLVVDDTGHDDIDEEVESGDARKATS